MATRYSIIFITMFLFAGCSSPGILYTNMTRPSTDNFENTPVGTKSCRVNAYRLKEPISHVGVSGEWNSEIIAKAMLKAGMTKCYYADVKTLSILRGAYRKKTLILYGD